MSETVQTTSATGEVEITTKLRMTVTDEARDNFQETLGDKPLSGHVVRIGVQGGGCGGPGYAMAFESEPQGEEVELNANGVRLAVNPNDFAALNGLTIDFETTEQGGGFKISGAGKQGGGGCGCGAGHC